MPTQSKKYKLTPGTYEMESEKANQLDENNLCNLHAQYCSVFYSIRKLACYRPKYFGYSY
jgi:hypothetical protein